MHNLKSIPQKRYSTVHISKLSNEANLISKCLKRRSCLPNCNIGYCTNGKQDTNCISIPRKGHDFLCYILKSRISISLLPNKR